VVGNYDDNGGFSNIIAFFFIFHFICYIIIRILIICSFAFILF
jgi:hypothetical protein